MKRILVLGANPARQKTLFFRQVRRGEVNRAARMEVFPSGKGVNFCRAAAVWGRARGMLTQFSGGENGRFVTRSLIAEGLECHNVRTGGNTRCCVTCLDGSAGVMTEIIEPSAAVSPREAARMLALWRELLPEADAAAVCGTLPDGSDYALYRQVAELTHQAGIPLLFDAWRELGPCLETGDNLLKINREELASLTGQTDLRAGLRQLFRTASPRFAAITDGPGRAFASDGTRLFVYHVPKVAEVVNPIGCGDTASAVLLSELVAGTAAPEAFRRALGAASANCLTSFPGNFDRAAAERFAAEADYAAERL